MNTEHCINTICGQKTLFWGKNTKITASERTKGHVMQSTLIFTQFQRDAMCSDLFGAMFYYLMDNFMVLGVRIETEIERLMENKWTTEVLMVE